METKPIDTQTCPKLTTDIILFCIHNESIEVLLVKREREPYKDFWALPGGLMELQESLEGCAQRVLQQKTGLKQIRLRELGSYSAVNRDPRGRVVTIAYWGVIDKDIAELKTGNTVKEVSWHPIEQLPDLAFDHLQIIEEAMDVFLIE